MRTPQPGKRQLRGDAICSRGSGAGKQVIYINQTPHFFLANACCWVCKLWWDPRPKLALGQLGVSGENPTAVYARALRDSTPRGAVI